MEKSTDHAVHLAMSYERFKGNNPINISKTRRYGADIFSNHRVIEVKSTANPNPNFVVLNPYNLKAMDKTGDAFKLYVVYDGKDPKIIELTREDILSHKRPETSWIIPIHSSDRKLNKVI